MEKPIIEIKHVGKRYNITHQRGKYVALRDVLANILKRPFGFLRHKARQAVGLESKREEFWALKDVNLTINKGEIIGIVGHNGAGKSTLLKILTGITPPTEGRITMRGRVASLLEVGTGFHPELTGRENISLNGAILGMTRREIARKFDEIVAFAGIEKFLDTPVKYYSSGMYVRLAFSVAAHMEPDILLVDEVLAVGDAEFQKKCLGKMEEVTQQDGRTIIFVSHNLTAIRNLCDKVILLEHGTIRKSGTAQEVIDTYLQMDKPVVEVRPSTISESARMQLTQARLRDTAGKPCNNIPVGAGFQIEAELLVSELAPNPQIAVTCTDLGHNPVFFTSDAHASERIANITDPGTYSIRFTFPAGAVTLNEGDYYLFIQPETNGVDGYGERLQLSLSVTKPHDHEIARDWSKERRNGPVSVTGTWEVR